MHLHQSIALAIQSSNQVNSAGDDGTPGFSIYDFVYPRNSSKRGKARALPNSTSQLFIAEASSTPDTRVRNPATPDVVDSAHFSSYAFDVGERITKLARSDINPYSANSTSDSTETVEISESLR